MFNIKKDTIENGALRCGLSLPKKSSPALKQYWHGLGVGDLHETGSNVFEASLQKYRTVGGVSN